jgi:hypothetical protein
MLSATWPSRTAPHLDVKDSKASHSLMLVDIIIILIIVAALQLRLRYLTCAKPGHGTAKGALKLNHSSSSGTMYA